MSDERIPATNPELLRRLRNWDDAPAWIEFVQSYEATILRWCRALRLGPEAEDEVAARVLTRLVFRMQTFRYDPSRSFRAWLWVLVRRVALSYHRERGASAVTLDFEPVDCLIPASRRPRNTLSSRRHARSRRRCARPATSDRGRSSCAAT